jgi:hypothetical protein
VDFALPTAPPTRVPTLAPTLAPDRRALFEDLRGTHAEALTTGANLAAAFGQQVPLPIAHRH